MPTEALRQALPASEKRHTVLLCEDSEFLNRVIREHLESRGHHVVVALDAERAWECAQATRPDVVITDYELPGMSGLDLLALINASGVSIPVIFMTSEGTERVAAEAVNLGACSYLIKGRREVTLQGIERCLARVFYQIRLEELNRELLEKLRRQNDELERIVQERTRDLQKALEDLRSLDKLKNEFMILMSHEMRTPVASILGFADICHQKLYENDEELSEIHGLLFQAGNKLQEFIKDAFELFEWLGKRRPLTIQPFDLTAMIERNLAKLRHSIAAKRVAVEVDVPEGLEVHADLNALECASERIVENAIKFSRLGGAVTISARRAGASVAIRYRDQGEGIAPERVSELFRPLHVLGDLNHHQEGHGLSLPIVKEVAGAHGGSIEVRSGGIGMGVEVELRLPCPAPSAATTEPAAAPGVALV